MNPWQYAITSLYSFESPYLLACSGGMDSVVLFHLLLEISPPSLMRVCHFDHGMREESSQEASFVEELCQGYQIPCRVEKSEKIPRSEEEARRYRRAFFLKTAKSFQVQNIFLAHHQDDQIETLLLRLLRGTGLYALQGMAQKSLLDHGVFLLRPLLPFTRREIQEECQKRNLVYREDASNKDPRYLRNRVRHELIPLLQDLSPRVDRSLIRLAQQAQTLPEIPTLSDLSFQTLNVLPYWLRAVALKKYLEAHLERMLDFDHIERILKSLSHGKPGDLLFLPKGYRLQRQFDRFLLSSPFSTPIPFSECILGLGTTGFWGSFWYAVTWGESELESSILGLKDQVEWRIQFNPDTIAFPLRFRRRRDGDRIQSIGLEGKRHEVKKLLMDAKIPQEQRAYFPLLVDAQENILWVPSLRKSVLLSGKGFVIKLQFFSEYFF